MIASDSFSESRKLARSFSIQQSIQQRGAERYLLEVAKGDCILERLPVHKPENMPTFPAAMPKANMPSHV